MSTSPTNVITRFTAGRTCPVCGGSDRDPRGMGERCSGFISGEWVHCSREEHAGRCKFHGGSMTYGHRLTGPCPCGFEHNPAPARESKAKNIKLGEIDRVYKYHDVAGKVLFEVVRFKNPKGFRQRRSTGNGKHAWNLEGIEPVLYHLPFLMAADPDQPVYLVEGEKDVEALAAADRLATCNPMGAGKWKDHYSETLAGRHVVIIPDNDQAGREHAQRVARSLHGTAASVKIVELPGLPEKGDVSDFLDAGGSVDQLDELASKTPEWPLSSEPSRLPEIVVTTREREVNDQAVKALASDPDLYRLGHQLATILHEGDAPRGVEYRDGPPPQLVPIDVATLRERMAATASWVAPRDRADGAEATPIHPPQWSVMAVMKRGVWPGIRPIVGIIEAPTIRPDGSILSTPGYDADTRLYHRPNLRVEPIPASPTRADAEAARDELFDLVSDFPFKDDTHKAAWLASLLTVIARPSFTGPAPLFAFDGNCPGSGKSKLADLVAVIASGRRMPRTIWPSGKHADEEMRKRITSLALAAERFALLDNVDAPLGGGPLDSALTSDTWKDRMLGSMATTPELPMLTVWFASGNNLQYRGDFLRRVLPCRLESDLENPEDRSGFKYPDLIGHAAAHRGRLVKAALVILRAHWVAGRPELLQLLGSFESWTKAVADPVAWITGVNPLEVRDEVKAADHGSQVRCALVEGWAELPNASSGLTVASALSILGQQQSAMLYDTLRSALMELSDRGNMPSAKSIGRHLNVMKDRNIGGHVLRGIRTRTGVISWKVQQASRPRTNSEACRVSGI